MPPRTSTRGPVPPQPEPPGPAPLPDGLQSELLDRLLEASGAGVALIGSDLRLLRVNPVLAEINGLPPEAHPGRTLGEVLGDAGRALEPIIHQVLRTGTAVCDLEVSGPARGEGQDLRSFRASYLPLWGGARRPSAVLALVVEVTDRVRAERESEARARAQGRLRLLVAASDALARARGVSATFEALVRVCVPEFADWIAVDLLEGDGRLRRVAERRADLALDACAQALAGADATPAPGSAVAAALSHGRPTLVSEMNDAGLREVAGEDRHLRALRAAKIESLMVLPLAARGLPFGVVRLLTTRGSGRRFRHDEFETGQELARRAALAADNARLLEAEQRARSRAERLHAVAAGLALAPTPEAVAEAVTREGMAALGASAVVIALAPEGEGELVVLGARGSGVPTAGAQLALEAAEPVAEAARTGRTVFLDSPAAWSDHYGHWPEAGSAWAALPLLVAGARGAVAWSFAAARALPAEERALAHALVRQCTLALERARLLDLERTERRRTERAAERSRRLYTLAAALNQAASAERVAEVIVLGGREALRADAGSLALLSTDQQSWTMVHSSGFPAEGVRRGRTFPFTPGRPLSDAVLAREPLLLGTREEWDARYPAALTEVRQSGLVAYAALPILAGGRPVAGLSFGFRTPQEFDEADRTLLATLAEQCAQALERARLFEAERRARAEAEAANRAKMDFLAVMSHELRTPLNAIGGYAELLEMGIRGPITLEQRSDLERIRRSQRHLLSLINDVLNFAKVEAGHLDLAPTTLEMGELLADLEPLVAPQMAAKELRYRVDAGRPVRAHADGEKVRQILLNLLSNAIKFTPPRGTVSVACALRHGQVEVRVRDTGIGIPADKLERIFDPFVQLDRGYTTGHEGTGLGLAISRDLARAMNGDLSVRSREGRGAVFTVVLPAA